MQTINNLTYQQRAELTKHPVTKQLFTLMAKKETNLCLSADVTHKQELIELIELTGNEICLLKTHIDIIEDFDQDLIQQLKSLSQKYQFLIFEDRKFADIGNTVKSQYSKGIYHIVDWADIINAHVLPGPGIIEGLKEAGMEKQRGLLLLAQMSSKQNLFTADYVNATVEMALKNKDFVIGFIAQNKLIDEPQFIHMTPGVNLDSNGDKLGQNYLHPHKVIIENQSDIIIVGRGIYTAEKPQQAAQQFRQLGWEAYLQRLY